MEKKIVSVKMQLFIRVVASAVFLVGLYLFFERIFKIGTINDIGLINALYLIFLQLFQIIGLVVSSTGMNKHCDPVNILFYKRYTVIWICQFLLYIVHGLAIMNIYSIERRNMIFLLIVILLIGIIGVEHILIISQYLNLEDKEFEIFVENYYAKEKIKMLGSKALL